MALASTFGPLLLALGAVEAPRGAVQILLESLQSDDFRLEELTGRLGSLPPDQVPVLFDILEDGAVPNGESGSIELDPWRQEAVLDAFSELSPTAVRAHLHEVAAEGAEETRRETAVFVLGEMGGREDVRLLVTVAAPADPAQPLGRELQISVTDALARIIARDSRALFQLRDAYDDCHEGLLASFPRAVRAARPPEGLQILTDLLGRAPAADALILAEIGHFGEAVRGVIDPMVLGDVRSYLGRADPYLVQGAALAVRKLDDTRAVPQLLRLLRHSDANVRRSADQALTRLADRDFRGDVVRWERWHVEQMEWWAREAPALITDLEVGEKAVVAGALNEVATRRIFRDELAGPLTGALSHPDRGLAALACSVIGKLGMRSAIDDLTELLEHSDPTVAGAALGALRRLQATEERAGPLTIKH